MKFGPLDKGKKVLLVGIFSLPILAGFYWYGYQPKIQTTEKLKKEIGILEGQIRQAEASLRNLEELEKRYQQIQAEVSLMEEVLPCREETTTLLRELFVGSEGLDIEFLDLGKPVFILAAPEAGKVKKITLTLKLRSPFFKFVEYLNRLENLHRLIHVTSLQVQAKEETLPKVDINLTLETYAWGVRE